jgi:uncharacterized protein (DUF342 family)
MTEQERGQWILDGFTLDQIDEIEKGKQEGVDVSVYARKDFFAIQMRQIREGLQAGIDVSVYADPGYDWFQMEEIRKGLEKGLDVSIYDSPGISYDRMRQLRKGLEEGVDLSKFVKLQSGIIRQLRKAYVAKISILSYIKEGYDPDQLEEILSFLKEGIDAQKYLSVGFRSMAIREICQGYGEGLDVAVYADTSYNWRQMHEIRLGLENRLDVSQYNHVLYSWQQMEQIRLGLMDGVDVDLYKSFMYTAREMKKRRLRLLEDGGTFEHRHAALVGAGHTGEFPFPGFTLTVSSDEMSATIQVDSLNLEISQDDVRKALRKTGITKGIDGELLSRLERGECSMEPLCIAKGKPPKTGEDGWYEFFFRTDISKTPKVREDGTVDYQDIEWYEMVEKGQKIAYYHEPTEGEPGYTVTGKTLIPLRGREQRMLTGRGFVTEPDGKTYTAAIDGKIELLENGRIEILRTLVIEEISIASGKVEFDGSVYVRGDVGTGTRIEATEDVVVSGYVEDAVIRCGGDVVLRKGMNGGEDGYIKAGGSVVGKFFESAKIYAGGDIRADYCMNCELYTEAKIIIKGANGSLMGGISQAVGGIQVDNLGNHAGIHTKVRMGVNDNMLKRKKEIEDTRASVEEELKILRNAYSDFLIKYPSEVRNTMEIFLKIEDAIFTKEKEMSELIQAKAKLEADILRMKNVKAVVRYSLYEGVDIEINGVHWHSRPSRAITIKIANGRIGTQSNEYATR